MKSKIIPKNKIIVVVGPTASGKSELAVKIAKKVGGEIISADSRQIYKYLDLGSGKVEGKWKNVGGREAFVYKGVPHYLIDEVSPRTQYTVAKFQKKARNAISDILKRDKVPVICGGTGHWADAVVFGQTLPEAKPDTKLRKKLERLTTPNLFKLLQDLDPGRAAEIDAKNPRRLVRALEIVMTTGKPVPKPNQNPEVYGNFKVEWIGLNPGMEVLEKKIKKRLEGWFKSGLINEVKNLKDPKSGQGLSWKRIESFGLEYKSCALYLQGKIAKEEMETLSYNSIRQYAKRQMTWFKRNKNIRWYADANDVKKF